MARSLHQWIALKRRRKTARRKTWQLLDYIAWKVSELSGTVPEDIEERSWCLLYLACVTHYRSFGRPLLPGCHWVKGKERPELVID